GTANDTSFLFKVQAVNAEGTASDWTETTITYTAPDVATDGELLLSVGERQVAASDPGFSVKAPTNLVLRASLTSPDADNALIYFYDTRSAGSTLIGSARGPDAEITWFQVPAGDNHNISAQAIVLPLTTGIPGGGRTYSSHSCPLTVTTVPELATYQ